ncbi:MAG: response regulator transcription factor [Oscillospiraceae bacterium]
MSTICIIEDDESIRTMLSFYLKSTGFEVAEFESGEDYFAQKPTADLFLLDVMLPGMDGVEILRRLRAGGDTAAVPVIMLTARNTELDKVKALDGGADDYIAKPFGLMELGSRVKAVLRRTATPEPNLTYEDLTIDAAGRTVSRGEEVISLTYKEFELLRLLVSRRGAVLTRDEILSSVWDFGFIGETRTVDMHIKSLRQKLGGDYIETVRSVGYKAR